jgi:hypothetical protein
MASLKKVVKESLLKVGLDVRLTGHNWADTKQFLPLEPTLAAARAAGLSLTDYIDTVLNNTPGATQATIDGMRNLGVFAGKIESVVEIGPGSGRYLEKTIAQCHPSRYEGYETALPWVKYLHDTYPNTVIHPTDGATLTQTPSNSVDLIAAHKVFVGVNLMTTLRYWQEMVRVTRAGGFVVFDIVTESGLTPELIDAWVATGHNIEHYPASAPRGSCIDYFSARGFAFTGSFTVPLGPSKTEVFAFKRLP